MKIKSIIVVLAAAFTTSAFAAEFINATITPVIRDAKTNKTAADAAGFIVGTDVFKLFTLDGKFDSTRTRNGGALVNDVQARGTFNFPVTTNTNLWARGGVGREFVSSNSNFGFYNYAGGVDYRLNSRFVLLADAERQNSFRAGHPHFTTYEAGVGFNLTKNDQVRAVYQRALGDVDTKGVQVGYTHSF